MSEASETYLLNIYDESLNNENTALDFSSQGLETVPTVENLSVVVLYLQNNNLRTLPDDFFPSLPYLVYLDLRDNRLTDIPETIKNHQSLTHLLLQNNCLTSLPDELGTVRLKVLQLNGNPLMYPPRDIINSGVAKILSFLHDKYINVSLDKSSEDDVNVPKILTPDRISYNSVIDENLSESLKIQLSEKCDEDSEDEFLARIQGKCPRLEKSRQKSLPSPYCQSAKYLKPLISDRKSAVEEKMKQAWFKAASITKRKDLLAAQEKILQGRKNFQALKDWRKNYNYRQMFRDSTYKLQAKDFPYDTNPAYMALLTREDITKDLPDKYRKNLVRRSKQTTPRTPNNDVHLAMKIKKLFENLEALDLNRDLMTPRTEQKVLLNEIQKISEIKQKLKELSTSNKNSVSEL